MSRVIRIIEDNLMEVDLIIGNEEKVIIIDTYFLMDRGEEGALIEWKNQKRMDPMITLKGGRYIDSSENLMKYFKVGDFIFFTDFAAGKLIAK